MSDQVKKTTRVIRVTVETSGKSDDEHERIVTWATENITKANRYFPHAFVLTALYDENDAVIGVSAHGTASKETQALLDELTHKQGEQPNDPG